MKDKNPKSPTERRKALRKILAGTGAAGVVAAAPESWVRPAINSVSLPAHARTSQPLSFSDTIMNASLSPDLLETLVPSAHAGFNLDDYVLCINFNADMQTYSATLWNNGEAFDLMRVENATVEMVVDLESPCIDLGVVTTTIELGPYNPAGIDYTITRGGDGSISGTAPPMDCQLATCPRDPV